MHFPFYICEYEIPLKTIQDNSSFPLINPDTPRLQVPAFALLTLLDERHKLLLCKIRRPPQVAANGVTLHVEEAIPVAVDRKAIARSGFGVQELDYFAFTEAPAAKVPLIKNSILERNPSLSPSYFAFGKNDELPDLVRHTNDALQTAVRLFGSPETLRELTEEQILDFDWQHAFPESSKIVTIPDGKIVYEYAGRLLYIQKVHATVIERALGVDLIYNYADEGRLVFVQYKCHKPGQKKYYVSSDTNHDKELKRMLAMPGVSDCPNLRLTDERDLRLCRCPAFIKLCARKVRRSASIPDASYYPVCTWKLLVAKQSGCIARTDGPHLNNVQFADLTRGGLIGSTRDYSRQIDVQLRRSTRDQRLRLFFEEVVKPEVG